jgi:hypothetical protein
MSGTSGVECAPTDPLNAFVIVVYNQPTGVAARQRRDRQWWMTGNSRPVYYGVLTGPDWQVFSAGPGGTDVLTTVRGLLGGHISSVGSPYAR